MNTKIARTLPWILIPSLVATGIEVDMTIPGFVMMAKYFMASEVDIQWTLGVNFLGFCLPSLFVGPLSNTYGRRTLMLIGFGLFCIGSIGCVVTNSLMFLYFCRFIQGVGASAIWVIAYVVIADVYEGAKASQVIGMLNAVLTASISIAPVVGAFICESYGWRATYVVIATLCIIAFARIAYSLEETNFAKKPLDMQTIISEYKQLLFSKVFIVHALVPSILLTGYMAYLGSISFLYVDKLNMPLRVFAIHQACVVGSFSIVSFYLGKIENHFGTSRTMLLGIAFGFLSIIMLITSSLIYPTSPIMFTTSMVIFSIGCAIGYGVVFSASLAIFPDLSGAASSLIMFLRVITCSFGLWLSGKLYTGALVDTAMVISLFTLIGLILAMYVVFYRKQISSKEMDALA